MDTINFPAEAKYYKPINDLNSTFKKVQEKKPQFSTLEETFATCQWNNFKQNGGGRAAAGDCQSNNKYLVISHFFVK